jgi:hypothetical protein
LWLLGATHRSFSLSKSGLNGSGQRPFSVSRIRIVAQCVVPQDHALVGIHPRLLPNASSAIAFAEVGLDGYLPRLGDADAVESIARDLAVVDCDFVSKAHRDATA